MNQIKGTEKGVGELITRKKILSGCIKMVYKTEITQRYQKVTGPDNRSLITMTLLKGHKVGIKNKRGN